MYTTVSMLIILTEVSVYVEHIQLVLQYIYISFCTTLYTHTENLKNYIFDNM